MFYVVPLVDKEDLVTVAIDRQGLNRYEYGQDGTERGTRSVLIHEIPGITAPADRGEYVLI